MEGIPNANLLAQASTEAEPIQPLLLIGGIALDQFHPLHRSVTAIPGVSADASKSLTGLLQGVERPCVDNPPGVMGEELEGHERTAVHGSG